MGIALVVALALLPVACGDEGGGGGATTGGGGTTGGATAPAEDVPGQGRAEQRTVDPATVGDVSGVVRVEGTVPEPKFLAMVGERYCIDANPPDGGYLDNRLLVFDGRLQNAVVWIEEGLEGYSFEPPAEEVTLDQVECLYSPRVIVTQRGQRIVVTTSDPIMHNVHTKPEESRPQNIAMPANSPPIELRLRRQEVMVEVVCDVHAWMKGWIGVIDHPYFQVTGADGAYSLQGVPPGDYVLGVWHETFAPQRIPITVGAEEDLTVDDIVFSL